LAVDKVAAIAQLKAIAAQGLIPCQTRGPAAVSRQLAALIGYRHGSRFKLFGYHLLVHRQGKSQRMTLFAQVPDWALSRLKSSREILEKYGYFRDDLFRLNCTVTFSSPNNQGLELELDEDCLWSKDATTGEMVACWPLANLFERLLDSQGNAIIVNAESTRVNAVEFMRLTTATIYSSPIIENFVDLIQAGSITVDHLISRDSSGKVVEKGPILKLSMSEFPRLFEKIEKISLL
jgi:hypothetical protein